MFTADNLVSTSHPGGWGNDLWQILLLPSLHTVLMWLSQNFSLDKLDIWLLGGPDQGLADSRPDSETQTSGDLKSRSSSGYKETGKPTDAWLSKAAGIIHKDWKWANEGQCLPAEVPPLDQRGVCVCVFVRACVQAQLCMYAVVAHGAVLNSRDHDSFLIRLQHLHLHCFSTWWGKHVVCTCISTQGKQLICRKFRCPSFLLAAVIAAAACVWKL